MTPGWYRANPSLSIDNKARVWNIRAFLSLSLVPYLAPRAPSGRFFVGSLMTYPDPLLRAILTRTQTIAMVGISANPLRPSYFVARYLGLRGFRVIGVNPGLAGQMLFGQKVYASLAEVPDAVDMVDIFRQSDAVPGILTEALARWPDLQTIWMQIGVMHPQAAAVAEARGVTVIQYLCPKQEYQRLFGELRKGGFATGIISSKL